MPTQIHDIDLLIHNIETLLSILKQAKGTLTCSPDLVVAHAQEEVAILRDSIEKFIRTIEVVPGGYEPVRESYSAKNVKPEIILESIETNNGPGTPRKSEELVSPSSTPTASPPSLDPSLQCGSASPGPKEQQSWDENPANGDIQDLRINEERSLLINTAQSSLSPSWTDLEDSLQLEPCLASTREASAPTHSITTSQNDTAPPISLGSTPNDIEELLKVDFNGEGHLPTALPSLDADDNNKILALIDFSTENIPPSWLHCQNKDEFRQRLSQFIAGAWLDDIVMNKVLTMLASQHGFLVLDSLFLDITQPLEHIEELNQAFKRYQGLILPLHVNDKNQGAREGRNHWVLIIIDGINCSFTSFGMELQYHKLWVDELLPAIRGATGSDQPFSTRNEQTGPYEQDSCCGLLCFLAVERHFGFIRLQDCWPAGTELRARYLQRLVQTWIAQSQLSALQGQGPVAASEDPIQLVRRSFSDLTTPTVMELTCSSEDHSCAQRDLKMGLGGLEISTLLDAIEDDSMVFSIKRRARLLQMIAECMIPTARAPCDTAVVMPMPNDSFVTPLMKFMELRSQTRVITFQQRLHLVEAAMKFDLDVARLNSHRELERKKRKRSRTSKGPTEPKDGKAELDVLRQALLLLGCHREVLDKPKKSIHFKLIQEGRQLRWLAQHLGQNFLATLPCTAVYPHDARLQFPLASRCFSCLRKRVDPAEYHNLGTNDIAYFLKWAVHIHPEFRSLGSNDPDSLRAVVTE